MSVVLVALGWNNCCTRGIGQAAKTPPPQARWVVELSPSEGAARCHGDDATPARDVGRTQSRADGGVRTGGACLYEEPQEGCGFSAPAASSLDSEKNEAAARQARQLQVGFTKLPRLATASDRADAGGIDSELGLCQSGKPWQTILIRRASCRPRAFC